MAELPQFRFLGSIHKSLKTVTWSRVFLFPCGQVFLKLVRHRPVLNDSFFYGYCFSQISQMKFFCVAFISNQSPLFFGLRSYAGCDFLVMVKLREIRLTPKTTAIKTNTPAPPIATPSHKPCWCAFCLASRAAEASDCICFCSLLIWACWSPFSFVRSAICCCNGAVAACDASSFWRLTYSCISSRCRR